MTNQKPANSAKVTFSDLFQRLEQAQLTANHYKLITAAVLGDMLEFFDYYIIGFVLAFIVVPWKLSFGATAIVLLSAGVGSLIGSFFFGRLADRIGRMPVFTSPPRPSPSPAALCSSPLKETGSSYRCFVSWWDLVWAGCIRLTCRWCRNSCPRVRGVVGGIVTALIPAGTLLGSVWAAFLTPVIGWRGLFLIGLAPALLSLLFRFWMRESPRWLMKQGRYEER